MKNSLLKFVTFLFLSPIFSAQAEESNFDPKGTWWVNLGAGGATLVSHTVDNAEANNTKGTGIASASFNYALFDNQFIELRASGTGDFLDLSCFLGCKEELNSLNEVGLLYGVMKKTKWYMVGASAGLAYTELEYKGGDLVYVPEGNYFTTEHTKRTSQTLGIPVEAQLFWTPTQYFGIGLIGLGNLNTEGSMVGGMLAIQLGNLR